MPAGIRYPCSGSVPDERNGGQFGQRAGTPVEGRSSRSYCPPIKPIRAYCTAQNDRTPAPLRRSNSREANAHCASCVFCGWRNSHRWIVMTWGSSAGIQALLILLHKSKRSSTQPSSSSRPRNCQFDFDKVVHY